MPYAISYRNNKPVLIYFEDLGEKDKPVIVMQHGDGNDSQNWKDLGYVERLLPDYRLILIDYLGFGRSDKLEDAEAYAMPLLSTDTIAVLDHLNLKRDVIFFGGSMGGRTGYELATNPEHAAYFSAFIINGMGANKNEIIPFFKQWAEAGGMENVVAEANKVMAAPFPEQVKQTFLRNPSNIYIAANTHPWPSIKEKLSHINKPVLLICGEHADERSDMEDAHQIISNSILKIIPGMDHAQAYWSGEKTVPFMREFIEQQ